MGLLFDIIKKYNFAPVIGNGNYKLQPVYVGDVVKVIIKCLEPRIKNKVYFVAGPEALTFNEIIDNASKILTRNPIKVHFPLAFIKVLLKPYELIARNPSLTYKKILMVTENKTCDISKTKRDLKFKPISFEEGLKKTLD